MKWGLGWLFCVASLATLSLPHRKHQFHIWCGFYKLFECWRGVNWKNVTSYPVFFSSPSIGLDPIRIVFIHSLSIPPPSTPNPPKKKILPFVETRMFHPDITFSMWTVQIYWYLHAFPFSILVFVGWWSPSPLCVFRSLPKINRIWKRLKIQMTGTISSEMKLH